MRKPKLPARAARTKVRFKFQLHLSRTTLFTSHLFFSVYSQKGARVVAGTLVIDRAANKILLVSSSNDRHKYICPKGGVEQDELHDFAAAALRETWEEAGVIGKLGRKLEPPILREITSERFLRELPENAAFPYTEFHFYELDFEKMEDVWPESYKRDRVWATPEEAVALLTTSNRPEMVTALKRSSLFQ